MKCKCGCGEECKNNRQFIHGHNARIKTTGRFIKGHNTWNKGFDHLDIETRKKISENNKGRPAWNKGLTGEEYKKHFKQPINTTKVYGPSWCKGLTKNKDERLKQAAERLSKTRIELFIEGKLKSWNKGIGGDPEYCEIWSDKEYKNDIKTRDHNTCQYCGITEQLSMKVYSKYLHIHHIDYNKKNCSPNNLITVCVSCNSIANGHRVFWKYYYENYMSAKLRINNET